MVADDVGVLLKVGQHLIVAAFAMAELEPVPDLDRVAGPVPAVALRNKGPRLPLNRLRMILCSGS